MSITITVVDPTRDESLRLGNYFFELAGYGKTAGITSHRFEPNAERVASLLKQQLEEMSGVDDGACESCAGDQCTAGPECVATSNPVLDTASIGFGKQLDTHAAAVAARDAIQPTAPAAHAPAGTLDKDGYPWDARIHSSSQAFNKDGSWRLRKNLDVVTLETVRAELKSAPSAPACSTLCHPDEPCAITGDGKCDAAAPAALAAPVAPVAPVAPAAPAAPVAPVAPVAPLPPTTTASTAPMNFGQFMQRVTAACAAKTFDMNRVIEACRAEGVDSMPLLATIHSGKVPAIAERLGLTV